ncbi:2ea1d62e-2a39-4a8f-8ed8-50849f5c15aa [Sclerotinia trifoliorum]|uniref:2ea1d62e-2a39-4a8f-8ed8-50849f5c15aa n=1 Tax=Sclerotinia trifoliorum TaxID=28548 RepID=A0A8H2W1F1_9HELO|nr:2ea1d62e-2a39-4a8f-8ed8-50849f5c15aa [Sclerotinia trifoliorum]
MKLEPLFAIMDTSTSRSISPRSPRSPIGCTPPLELQYVDIRLRQHQQHLTSPDITPPFNSTTPKRSKFEDIFMPDVTFLKADYNENDPNNGVPLQTLLDWDLTLEETDVARRWGQDPVEKSKEMVHMRLLAECATSINYSWSRGDINELRREYDARMARWNSTIKKSNQNLEERRARKVLFELVTTMEMAGYGNEEMRWVSEVLNYREQTFWAVREWCETRLEKVRGEIERKQQRRIPEMEIETHEIVEARGHTQERGTEKETKEMRARTSRRDVNSRGSTPQITDTQAPTQTKNSRRNANSGNHTPSHDTQERTSQINDTLEPTQATDTRKYTRVIETPNPTQITNIRNHTQDIMGHESMRKTEKKKCKPNIKAQEREASTQQPIHISNIRKRTNADSNNLDSNTAHTKRLRRSPRLKSILDLEATKNGLGD